MLGGSSEESRRQPPVQRLKLSSEWQVIAFDINVATQEYVELVCDFAGSVGDVQFDLDSLKLVRLPK